MFIEITFLPGPFAHQFVQFCTAHFTKLRMLMNIPTPFDHLRHDLRRRGVDVVDDRNGHAVHGRYDN